MKSPSDSPENGDALREKLIGLGERSLRKSYYPELQQRLRELERFKAFLDHSNDAIFLIQVPSARILDLNESSCRQLGWSREELLALSIFDVTELADNDQAKKLVCETGEEVGGRALVETVLHKRDGTPIPAEITLDRMVFEDSAYVIAVARDIEKRKRAEEALRKSEKQYHTLAEASPIGIFYTDAAGEYLYVNDRWIEITGYSREEALKMNLAWGDNPEDRSCAVEEWFAAARKGQPFKAEYYFQRREGKSVWLYSQVLAEKDDRGEVVGYVGTITDITDRKRAEEELRESEERRLRLQAQLEFAAEVQAKLLPQKAPVVAGFEIAARCLPAYQVAGDFYDWQQLAPGLLLTLTLGDVMGKGLAAAMLMATVRATLRAVTQEHKPAVALQLAEKALRQDLDSSDSFVTLFHAQLDLGTRSLTYVDCGHGLVFLRRSAGRVEELHIRGLPLGVFSKDGFQEGTVTFEDGDALVLYSDGLIDALPELALDNWALAGRLDGSASAREMVDRLIALVPPEAPLPDDMTVLVVRCLPGN
jgi:PAS domain S-box-containing protein